METSIFNPLIEHFGEKTPRIGDLFLLCSQTNNKELFLSALLVLTSMLKKINSDVHTEKKIKILLMLDQRIKEFN